MNKTMIIDTNILIRLFTEDDNTQIEYLVQLMEQGNIGFRILTIVLIETYWVLSKVYKFDKQTILDVFEEFIEADGVELDEDGLVQRVLAHFRRVNTDFVDVYLAEKSKSLGLSILTWNTKDFKKSECEFYRPQDLI